MACQCRVYDRCIYRRSTEGATGESAIETGMLNCSGKRMKTVYPTEGTHEKSPRRIPEACEHYLPAFDRVEDAVGDVS